MEGVTLTLPGVAGSTPRGVPPLNSPQTRNTPHPHNPGIHYAALHATLNIPISQHFFKKIKPHQEVSYLYYESEIVTLQK